ncbi:transcription factor bHLH35-like [Solanum stenotomum]|uniref:transcription factor bHLH35-like n=1 Tax=Solanum stenotomum TaxID=172797 RepID=UPI0020D12338|nr:transcription factor bHLH35-like [Solanum stenotomum]
MENMVEENNNYLETTMFFQPDSYLDEPIMSSYYDSSSPEGAQSSKNIVSERIRRNKLKEKLFALRALVPKITKMDKASIVKDAIGYIEELQKQDRRIQGELSELESETSNKNSTHLQHETFDFSKPKRPTTLDEQQYGYHSSPIDVLQLKVSSMRDKTVVVNLTCIKRRDTMVKLCDVFESLNIKITSATIFASSGTLLNTAFIEADEEDCNLLKLRIETAIASLNNRESPMSS